MTKQILDGAAAEDGGSGGGGGGGAATLAAGSVSSGAYVAGSLALGAIVDLGTGASPGANTVNGRLAVLGGCVTSSVLAVSDATTHTDLATINTTLGTPMQATGGTVGLVAGSAIVGKVGIDQTTPGTTNAVVASLAAAQTLANVTTLGTITNDVNVLPATDALVWGAASATGASSTQAIALSSGKSIYVTSVRVKNSSATPLTVLIQDGSGGTTLDVLIAPAGGGDNSNAGGAVMYKTTSGNGLYFQVSGSGGSTVYCNASGFAK